ncbi:MAG: hypothetical protein QM647_10465 [Asticcacaulis sp.]|uniref:hypothetical protein n=1 Tax=Asticcacaulis sp. TaxID=1872648 RepID=UPI0039E6EF8B
MRAVFKNIVIALLGIGLLSFAGGAMACDCKPSAPTKPSNPRPPQNGCNSGCGGGGGSKSSSYSSSRSSSSSNSTSSSSSYSGGYSNWSQTPGYPQSVGALNVVGGDESAFESYSEQQTFTKQTIIQASCIDDTGVPHPASQVFAGRDIAGSYRGEVYRCIAGTHMQWTYSDYDGSHINFDGGKNATCAKNEALWFENGALTCKVQIPQRQCNERSLLRRFGVGVKVLTLTRTETITKQRQVASARSSAGLTVMTFDGGVGGFVQ